MSADTDAPFLDAEAWLAARGVERRTLVDVDALRAEAEAEAGGEQPQGEPDGRPDVSPAEAQRLAADAVPGGDAVDHVRAGPPPTVADVPTSAAPLEEVVAATVATIRRITGGAPASEGRVRRKLRARDLPAVVIEQAMARARRERLVDDDALAAALVAEWRVKGHAPRRLRDDLRRMEFDEEIIVRAVAVAEDGDHGAAAFGLARERAGQLTHVPAETAVRRTAAYLARRGYGEGLARKAARDAVHDSREGARIAGR